MKIRSYKLINLYNKMERTRKQQKVKPNNQQQWLKNYFRDNLEIGDIVIIQYEPEFESNFDHGCIYVFRKTMFSYKCLDFEDINPITNDVHKQAERIIDKFKIIYYTTIVIKGSWN